MEMTQAAMNGINWSIRLMTVDILGLCFVELSDHALQPVDLSPHEHLPYTVHVHSLLFEYIVLS